MVRLKNLTSIERVTEVIIYMRSAFLSVFILLILSTGIHSTAQIIQQQVIPGELPDPSIIEVDGVYYACGSSNDWGPVYPIYQSTDLQHWTFVTYVFSTPPAWTISSYWAPELFYHNGTFYCYYTARRTDGTSCIGVATTKNIQKGFKDQGQIIEWGNEAIDAFVYNENGTLYITWKAYGLNPDKPIQLLGSELTEDGLALKGEAFTVLTADTNSWENGGMEGQCIVKNGDYLYMLYSGNACCGAECGYQVGVARAKTMKGPWEKADNNPLLKGNDTWKCPGHGTALQTGNEWYYLYHAYPAQGFPYLGRASLLSHMHWDEQTGWPYFNVEAANADPTVLMEDIADDFNTKKLENWWHYDIPSYTFKTSIRNSQLTLTEEKRNEDNATGSALCVIPEYADFTITTQVNERNEALKGLVFYATSANSVGLGVEGNNLILWKVQDKQFIELNRLTLDQPENIFLKASAQNAHIIEFQYSHDGENWKPIANLQNENGKVIGDNLDWWSWGMKTGLFVKADPATGQNKAVFDEFALEYQR